MPLPTSKQPSRPARPEAARPGRPMEPADALSHPGAAGDILGLQRSLGNRAVSRMLAESAAPLRPADALAIQRMVGVPAANTPMKVADILSKLEDLLKEAGDREQQFLKIRGVLLQSFAAIDDSKNKSVQPDHAMKVSAVESYIDLLRRRTTILKDKQAGLGKANKSTVMPTFDFGVDPLPDVENAENMIASDKQLDDMNAWFGKESVDRRKAGHKVTGATAPGVTPNATTPENIDAFLRQPAAPLLHVTWDDLVSKLGGYKGCAFQGVHGSKEKNLPDAKFVHHTFHLIELSVSIGKLAGGRAVVNIENGDVYLTEHYGQNIVKLLTSLYQVPNRTAAQEQELHALMLLKKLVNDFVLVGGVPGAIHDEMLDIACEAYLENHVAAQAVVVPPTNTSFHAWCRRNPSKVRAKLRENNIHKLPRIWESWMSRVLGLEIASRYVREEV